MSKHSPFSYLFTDIRYIFLNYKAQHWIRTLKTAFDNFYVNFFNNDFSVDISSITLHISGNVLYTLEGSVSQNFDLGPG